MCLTVCISIYLCICLSVCLFFYASVCVSICVFASSCFVPTITSSLVRGVYCTNFSSVCMAAVYACMLVLVHLSPCLPACMFACFNISTSVPLSICLRYCVPSS